jgi:glycosyltransferase involved in cell wall biosynthesis
MNQADGKVLFISPFSENAASSTRMKSLSKSLDNAITIYPLEDRYGRTKGKYTINARKSSPTYLLYAYNTIRKFNPSVIYFLKPNPYSFIPALMYHATHRCKLVLDLDEWDTYNLEDNKASWAKVSISRFITWLAIRVAKIIIVSNERIKELIPGRFQNKIVYIPNGVDTRMFSPKNKASKSFKVVYVGSLYNKQQLSIILDSTHKIRQVVPNAEFTIIGPGDISQLKKEAADFVEFTGRIPHDKIPEALADANVVLAVFPKMKSIDYASNMKLFEYMAMGKTIIASNVGQISEVLENGRSGYILKENNSENLIEIMQNIHENPEEANKKGERARGLAIREYDWQVLSKRLKVAVDTLSTKI